MIDRIDIKYFKIAVGNENIGKETDVDISARCPICGDSSTNKRMKRLHLYNKGTVTNVSCFNGDCAAKNKTMYSFLRDFYPALLDQYKRENFKNTLTNLSSLSTKDESVDVFKDLFDENTNTETKTPDKKEVITQDLSMYLTKLEDSELGLNYIKNRGYDYKSTDYGNWYFGHQDLQIGDVLYKITNSLVIPLYYNNEMYGFYSRNISNKTFYTFMNDANIGYKIWNWFNINKNEPVYIFEGIFDAISSGLPNCIALIGAKIPTERLNELSKPVFVLDNDRTGIINAIEYANKGADVYIQPIDFKEKDMNELKLNNIDLNIKELIKINIFNGISAVVRLKSKL